MTTIDLTGKITTTPLDDPTQVENPSLYGANRVNRAAYGGLPLRMKVLYITTQQRTGAWLAEAFAADSASKIVLQEVHGSTAGLTRLRDEVFDVVLVSHQPEALNALDLTEGLRVGGNEEPIIVLGTAPTQSIDALCYEVGADDYCCVTETTVRGLLWKLARAIGRHQLERENGRLRQAEQQRLQQEHHEADRLLEQQMALIADLKGLHQTPAPTQSEIPPIPSKKPSTGLVSGNPPLPAVEGKRLDLPPALLDHYRDLLRTYVIMGAGNLSSEMASLAKLLATTGVSAQRAMQLHVQILEELVHGLGNRSARHVMSRADLLILEVMSHLADSYRQRYLERSNPPQQLLLPGFEDPQVEFRSPSASATPKEQCAEQLSTPPSNSQPFSTRPAA